MIGPEPEDFEYEVRIVDDSGLRAGRGRVEVKYDDTWGTVCNENWGDNEAATVCRMLGYKLVVLVTS